VGPTVDAEEARSELDAVYLPPAAQGDVYRIGLLHPKAIGIIDGYFHRVPAVWHKEILWAMTQGIHVFGAASMGALRAAELASFGMEGVGAIFQAYRAGVLKDDDEVVVTHGPADTGFKAHSEAMVNIRATFRAAEAHNVISRRTRGILERVAKRCFYAKRIYPLVLRQAAQEGVPSPELEGLRVWLPRGAVNQKRADALELLRRMREFLTAEPPPKRVEFRLENTLQWQRVSRFSGIAAVRTNRAAEITGLEALLDELGLEADAYPAAYQAALLSHLALLEARSSGYDANGVNVTQMRRYFCEAHGLRTPGDVDCWLRDNHLTSGRLDSLLEEEAIRARLFEKIETEVVSQLPDHLRLVGDYARLLARAQQKKTVLERRGSHFATPDEAGVSPKMLLEWYFTRRGQPVCDDISNYARAHGFGTGELFVRALVREYCYVRALESELRRESPDGLSD
jgi:hypothetical protein